MPELRARPGRRARTHRQGRRDRRRSCAARRTWSRRISGAASRPSTARRGCWASTRSCTATTSCCLRRPSAYERATREDVPLIGAPGRPRPEAVPSGPLGARGRRRAEGGDAELLLGAGARRTPRRSVRVATSRPRCSAPVSWLERCPARSGGQSRARSYPMLSMLANGVKPILILRDAPRPIAFVALVRGGARLDPDGRDGVASVAAELSCTALGATTRRSFADAVEGAAGSSRRCPTARRLRMPGFPARSASCCWAPLADALERLHFELPSREAARAAHRIHQGRSRTPSPKADCTYGRVPLLRRRCRMGSLTGGSETSLGEGSRARTCPVSTTMNRCCDRMTLAIAGGLHLPSPQLVVARLCLLSPCLRVAVFLPLPSWRGSGWWRRS